MKKQAFANAANIFIKSSNVKGELVSVTIGSGGTAQQYLLMDAAGGTQPFRTQYDMAIDGSQFILTAGKGVGTYEFKLLEGPLATCDRTTGQTQSVSFFADYKKMKNAASRKIVIVTKVTNGSTNNSLTFRGLVNQVNITAARDEDGESYILAVVSATGIWT